jgi:hypothetical protein
MTQTRQKMEKYSIVTGSGKVCFNPRPISSGLSDVIQCSLAPQLAGKLNPASYQGLNQGGEEGRVHSTAAGVLEERAVP